MSNKLPLYYTILYYTILYYTAFLPFLCPHDKNSVHDHIVLCQAAKCGSIKKSQEMEFLGFESYVGFGLAGGQEGNFSL